MWKYEQEMICNMFDVSRDGVFRCNVLDSLKADDALFYIYSRLQPCVPVIV